MGDTFNFLFSEPVYRDTFCLSMALFIAFVLNARSWAAHIRPSVFGFSSSAFSHCHLHSSYILSSSLCRSSFFFPSIFFLSCNFLVAAFRSLSALFAAYSKRLDLSSSIQRLTLYLYLYILELLVCTNCQQKSVGVKTFMHIQEFPCLSVNFIQLSFIPVDYSSPIPNCCYIPYIDCIYDISTIRLRF